MLFIELKKTKPLFAEGCREMGICSPVRTAPGKLKAAITGSLDSAKFDKFPLLAKVFEKSVEKKTWALSEQLLNEEMQNWHRSPTDQF